MSLIALCLLLSSSLSLSSLLLLSFVAAHGKAGFLGWRDSLFVALSVKKEKELGQKSSLNFSLGVAAKRVKCIEWLALKNTKFQENSKQKKLKKAACILVSCSSTGTTELPTEEKLLCAKSEILCEQSMNGNTFDTQGPFALKSRCQIENCLLCLAVWWLTQHYHTAQCRPCFGTILFNWLFSIERWKAKLCNFITVSVTPTICSLMFCSINSMCTFFHLHPIDHEKTTIPWQSKCQRKSTACNDVMWLLCCSFSFLSPFSFSSFFFLFLLFFFFLPFYFSFPGPPRGCWISRFFFRFFGSKICLPQMTLKRDWCHSPSFVNTRNVTSALTSNFPPSNGFPTNKNKIWKQFERFKKKIKLTPLKEQQKASTSRWWGLMDGNEQSFTIENNHFVSSSANVNTSSCIFVHAVLIWHNSACDLFKHICFSNNQIKCFLFFFNCSFKHQNWLQTASFCNCSLCCWGVSDFVFLIWCCSCCNQSCWNPNIVSLSSCGCCFLCFCWRRADGQSSNFQINGCGQHDKVWIWGWVVSHVPFWLKKLGVHATPLCRVLQDWLFFSRRLSKTDTTPFLQLQRC